MPFLAAACALASAWAVSDLRRWSVAERALARTGTAPEPGRPLPEPLAQALRRAGVESDHRTLVGAWLAAVALAVALSLVVRGGPVLAGAVALGPPLALVAARNRGARRRTRQLPLALDAIAAGLRGGSSLRSALGGATAVGTPVGAELAEVVRRAEAGRPLSELLTTWAGVGSTNAHAGTSIGHDASTRLAGAALVVAAELGGPGAAAVDAAAASLRDRAAAEDEVAALSVQARLSALVLTLAPIGFAFLLTTFDPTSARFLLGTPAGWACVAAGLVLDLAGAAWMARLVRRAR